MEVDELTDVAKEEASVCPVRLLLLRLLWTEYGDEMLMGDAMELGDMTSCLDEAPGMLIG